MKANSSLSLYKRYRFQSITKPSTKRYNSPKSTPKASRKRTPDKSTNKRFKVIGSPVSTPRRSRRSPLVLATKLLSPENINKQQTDKEWIDIEDYLDCQEEPPIQSLNYEFKKELEKAGVWVFFERFMELVVSNNYPLDNIALLLFLDSVKFFDSASTSSMKYFQQTKRFWKAGLRLFHTKFLYLMGGPKSIGQLDEFEDFECYSPKMARINFAVPSLDTLTTFDVLDSNTKQRMPTGMLDTVLTSISNSETDKQYMLCADAKKVTAGIDKLGGDVDLFGFEDGVVLEERKKLLSAEAEVLKTAINSIKEDSVAEESILGPMRYAVTTVSQRLRIYMDDRSPQLSK